MDLVRTMIRAYFYTRYGFNRLTTGGAFSRPTAEYLTRQSGANEALNGNRLKSALFKHHVKQFHESSCSVASVATILNAILEVEAGNVAPITQAGILDRVGTGYWRLRMGPDGHNGRRGLPLKLLGEVVASSLNVYGIRYRRVETVPTPRKGEQVQKARSRLRARLIDFESAGNSLMIAHFDQGALLPTLNIPHISPVGGYDPENDSVTVLDVDPDQSHPYRVGFDTFYKGLSGNYHQVLRAYGYNGGGYIYVRLREQCSASSASASGDRVSSDSANCSGSTCAP